MSLIDRLRQLVGPPAADPTVERRLSREARLDGVAVESPSGVQRLLDSIRDAMADYTALTGESTDVENSTRYWSERLKQAERLVEREAVGSPGALRASDLAGNATVRVTELQARQKAIQEALDAGRPAYDEANALLIEVRAAQDRARAAASGLALEDASAEAALAHLRRSDATGLDRLQALERNLRGVVARAEASGSLQTE